uniref:Uncharacterized protein n=1 Tax=Triticum urartu TaxID=4572 RepID=A0A8R7TRK4_TRIUA
MYTGILIELMLEMIKSSIIFVSRALEKLTPHTRSPSPTYILFRNRVHMFTHVLCFLLFRGRLLGAHLFCSPGERELDIVVLASVLMDTSFWPFLVSLIIS